MHTNLENDSSGCTATNLISVSIVKRETNKQTNKSVQMDSCVFE